MLLRVFVSLFLAIICAACGTRATQPLSYQATTETRPSVALLPTEVNVVNAFPWDMSRELNTILKQRLEQEGSVVVVSDIEPSQVWDRFDRGIATSAELSAMHRAAPSDFVVITELVDHSVVPYQGREFTHLYRAEGTPESVLMMALRVKVLDMRQAMPKVVLQEIVHVNQLITTDSRYVDYGYNKWGNVGFLTTPVGKGHARLLRDTSDRICQYIFMDTLR